MLKHSFCHSLVYTVAIAIAFSLSPFGTIAFILIWIIYMLVCHFGELLLFLQRIMPCCLVHRCYSCWSYIQRAKKNNNGIFFIHFLVGREKKEVLSYTMKFDDHVFAYKYDTKLHFLFWTMYCSFAAWYSSCIFIRLHFIFYPYY